DIGHLASAELEPVVRYMKYFRNAGILVFLVILVTSSLFINGALAWVFAVLGLSTIFYFNRGPITRFARASYLAVRIEFVKRGRWMLWFSLLLLLAAFILRVQYQWSNVNLLLVLSFMSFGIYVNIWLLLSSNYDPAFGEIGPGGANALDESKWS